MKVTIMRVMEVERGFTNYRDGTKVGRHRGIVILWNSKYFSDCDLWAMEEDEVAHSCIWPDITELT